MTVPSPHSELLDCRHVWQADGYEIRCDLCQTVLLASLTSTEPTFGSDGRQVNDLPQRARNMAQVIAASLRHPLHVTEAALAGAHVATIPYDVLKKMLRHNLTDAGIQKFLKDWEKVPKE